MLRLLRRLGALGVGLLAGTFVAVSAAAPAQAAVPDVWAFAYLDDPNPPAGYVMDTTRQWGTFKSVCSQDWITVTNVAIGVYQIRIPCSASTGGIVHVTAVDSAGQFCQAARWGPAGTIELVYVICHDAVGVRANARFTVLYTTSSGAAVGGSHAYVHADPAGTVVASFNSTGGANSVTRLGPGFYRVLLPNLASGDYAGDLQLTASLDLPRRCRVADWARGVTDYTVYVACSNWAGVNTDTWFTLSYHRKRAVFGALGPPSNLGYVLAGSPSPDTNYNPVAGPNLVVPVVAGLWDVTYPGVGTGNTHLQVTAFHGRPVYCQLADVWTVLGTDVTARVACFEPGGLPASAPFFATYSSNL